MEVDLLKLKLNQFQQEDSMRSARTINALRQQLSQNPGFGSEQKYSQIFNKGCELTKERYFGNTEHKGIIGIYTDYFTKYPEELTEAKINDILKEEISKIEGANKQALLAERQKGAQRKADDKVTGFYLGQLHAFQGTLLVKVKEALTINLQQILKDYNKKTAENAGNVLNEDPENKDHDTVLSGKMRTIEERIDDFWDRLSAIDLIHSPLAKHTCSVAENTPIGTINEKIVAIRELLNFPTDIGPCPPLKEVVLESWQVISWINSYPDAELMNILNEYREYDKLGEMKENYFEKNKPPMAGQLVYEKDDLFSFLKYLYNDTNAKSRLLDFAQNRYHLINTMKSDQITKAGPAVGQVLSAEIRKNYNRFFEIVQSQWTIVKINLGIGELPAINFALNDPDGSDRTISPDEFKPILDIIRNDLELLDWLKKQSPAIFSDELIKYLWDCDKSAEWLLNNGTIPIPFAHVRNQVFKFLLELSDTELNKAELQEHSGRKLLTAPAAGKESPDSEAAGPEPIAEEPGRGNELILNEAINKAAFPIAKALVPDEYEEGLFEYDPAYQHTPLDFARERLTLLESALYGLWGSPLARSFFGDLVQWQGDFQNKELWLAVADGELLDGYFMTFGDTVAQAHMRSIIKERNPWMESNGRNGGATGIRFEPEINHIKIIDCATIPEHNIAKLARARIPLIDMVDTGNISSLGFPNPFCSMFKGKADEKLFENCKACIKSSAFWRAWAEKRHAKEIRALPQKQPLKEDTPREGTTNEAGETGKEKEEPFQNKFELPADIPASTKARSKPSQRNRDDHGKKWITYSESSLGEKYYFAKTVHIAKAMENSRVPHYIEPFGGDKNDESKMRIFTKRIAEGVYDGLIVTVYKNQKGRSQGYAIIKNSDNNELQKRATAAIAFIESLKASTIS